MIRIAVVGEIGSGKTYIARLFGLPIFNADNEVADIYKKDKTVYRKLRLKLPKYISLKNHEKDSNKYYIIYDKKTNINRISLKAIFNKSEAFSQNLELFLEKIENKLNNN